MKETAMVVDSRGREVDIPRVVEAPPASMLEVIERASKDVRVDVDKLERLLAIQQQIRADEARAAYNAAMAACQDELPAVVRDARNESNSSRYARLETVIASIRPVIAKHGFALTFSAGKPETPGNICVVCQVRHSAGHTEPFQLEAAPDTAGPKGGANKTAIQGLGATVSYLRRYLTLMAFNIAVANEDRDGQKTGFITEQQAGSLASLLSQCGGDTDPKVQSGFLSYMGAKSVSEIHCIDFRKAIEALQSKLRQIKKQAAEVTEVLVLPDAVEIAKGQRRRCKGKVWEVVDDGDMHRWKEVG